jgi:hypothetical protein
MKSDLFGLPVPGSRFRFRSLRVGLQGENVLWFTEPDPTPNPNIRWSDRAPVQSGFVTLPAPPDEKILGRGARKLRDRRRERNAPQPDWGNETVEELMTRWTWAAEEKKIGAPVLMFSPQVTDRESSDFLAPALAGTGALDDFVRFADSTPDDAILHFAAHWGVIGICSHMKPFTHSIADCSIANLTRPCWPLGAEESDGKRGWEPIGAWRAYSRQAGAMLQESADLRTMTPTSDSAKAERARRVSALFAQISDWLNMANVPVAIVQSSKVHQAWPNGYEAGFAPKNLFGLLAIQLFHNIMGSRGLANCAHCGWTFPITRERTGARRFCDSCRHDKVSKRYASLDWWRKNKAGNSGGKKKGSWVEAARSEQP